MGKSFSDELYLGIVTICASFGGVGLAAFVGNPTAVINWWMPWLIYVAYLFSKHSKKTRLSRITHRFSDDPLIWGIVIGLSAIPVILL